ncbi:MAG: hypothetical protein IKS10_04635 [Lachnospiraceae bacterium]|nr:hypothetical protein [Lachnospiraceae bacterium]
MAEDIVPGLQEAIEKDFQNSFQTDSTLISIYEKIQNGTATQKDGEAFARELGTVLTDVFHRNVTPEQLPDGRMYYNIANRLIPPALEQNHGLVNEVMRQIITKQNADAGIGLRYQDADLDEDKVHGLVERAANYPQYEVVQNDVETGLTTFTQGVADEAVHKDAAFQASAGLHPRIVRETDGDCCKWCLDLAGTYDYESAPPEVYARHANCGCSVEFRPGDGKRQDVWSKALISDAEFAKIDARKEAEGLPDDVGVHSLREKGTISNFDGNFERVVTPEVKVVFDEEFKRAQDAYGPISTIGMVFALNDNSNDYGVYYDNGGMLGIRYANKKNAMELLGKVSRKKFSTKEWSTADARHVFRHEIGHAIQNEHDLYDPKWPDKLKRIGEIYDRVISGELQAPSNYSKKYLAEFISECIAESYVKKPREVCRMVTKILKEV